MVIIQLMGGLGNQMYAYALYSAFMAGPQKAMLHETGNIGFDTWNERIKWGSRLTCFPAIQAEMATARDLKRVCDIRTGPVQGLMNRFGIRLGTPRIFTETAYGEYDPSLFEMDNTYLQGYWQNPGYFKDITADLKRDFVFFTSEKAEDMQAEDRIRNTNSVSVHIRRGDYLKFPEIYGGICTEAYYQKALEIIQARVEEPCFFFFTDDPEWVRSQFKMENMTVVDWNASSQESWRDMRLMHLCKHNIIANSSFSWWAAWLNDNPNRLVLSPALWESGKPLAADRRIQDWIYLE